MANPRPTLRAVPPELASLVEKSAKRITGKHCYGIPDLGFLAKPSLQLIPLGDVTLYEKTKRDFADWLPFAQTAKSDWRFLVISTTAPYAVGWFDKRVDQIDTIWTSLPEFMKQVIAKTDKTPFDLTRSESVKACKNCG